MTDYLDAMIKAHDAIMYGAEDCWARSIRRAAMELAYKAAQDWFHESINRGNPVPADVLWPRYGDGVALMSISHPPCAMFPEKEEETQAERIARVTREMCRSE